MVQGIAALQAPVEATQAAPQIPEEAKGQLEQAFKNLSEDEIESLRELTDDLGEMSKEELTALKQIIDFINRRSDQYDAAVQTIIRQGLIEPGDLPPDYDPVFFDILSQMVDSALQGAEAPQQFAAGGIASLKKKSRRVAKAGRKGDTMLAHLSPGNADMLRRMGGAGTTNPKTGLPEYFLGGIFKSIGSFFKKAASVVLPIALGLTPLGPIFGAAIGSGLGAMINGASPAQALQAGLLGGVGGALYSGVSSWMNNQGFMAGVTGALPKGMQAMFASPTTMGPAIAPSTSTTDSSYFGDIGSYAGSKAAGAQTAAAPGMFQSAKNWISANPMLAVGGAGLAGLALASAMTPEEQAAQSIGYKGATPEQVAAARFAPGTFQVYQAPRVNVVPTYSPAYAATGGEIDARRGGHLSGPGTGTSDSIPARLSDGEFVMTAKAVRGAGNGSRMKGAKRMYDMMHKFEKRA